MQWSHRGQSQAGSVWEETKLGTCRGLLTASKWDTRTRGQRKGYSRLCGEGVIAGGQLGQNGGQS